MDYGGIKYLAYKRVKIYFKDQNKLDNGSYISLDCIKIYVGKSKKYFSAIPNAHTYINHLYQYRFVILLWIVMHS